MSGTFDNLVDYYNKFPEEKRLDSRHGQVEFRISMKYIRQCLRTLEEERGQRFPEQNAGQTDQDAQAPACRAVDQDGGRELLKSSGAPAKTSDVLPPLRILDIGAGTGRYSVPLSEAGYEVTAVELVRYNLGVLKTKKSAVRAIQGDARNLSMLPDNAFDLTLLFGPLYHLIAREDKLQALSEAKRVTRPGGYVLAAYCMNEYSVVTYAFKERHILECLAQGRLSADFRTQPGPADLYDYVRLEDIDGLCRDAGLARETILSPDGPADYLRPYLNKLTEEEFEAFVRYQEAVCERPELLGAGAHIVDILRKH